MKKVSIVVPVYGDWESLSKCIDSINKHASNSSKFKVYYVNDRGPDHEFLKRNILASISGVKNAEYFENSDNLGFVKSCNRAVFEIVDKNTDVLLLNSDTEITESALGEIQRVAYISDDIGVVCPRSNNATIATLPLSPRNKDEAIDIYELQRRHAQYKHMLPELSYTPVAVGFCFYIKRHLVDQYGLFDEIYGKGYGEENDFCLRLREAGYKSAMANRAFVIHLSARSFSIERKREILKVNEKVLLDQFPYYNALLENYSSFETTFSEVFFETLTRPPASKTKILIDIHSLPAVDSEEYRYVAKQINSINSIPEKMSITVVGSSNSLNFHKINNHALTFIEPHEVNEQFDYAISLLPITDMNNLRMLLETSVVWIIPDSTTFVSFRPQVSAEEIKASKTAAYFADYLYGNQLRVGSNLSSSTTMNAHTLSVILNNISEGRVTTKANTEYEIRWRTLRLSLSKGASVSRFSPFTSDRIKLANWPEWLKRRVH